MHTTTATTTVVALLLLPALTPAQFLSNTDYGSLPECAASCPALTSAQQSCGGGNADWSCFCETVWGSIGSAPEEACAQVCQQPAQVSQWYTANCGSDNGATAHPGSSSGGGSGSGNGDGGNGNGNGNGDGNGDGNGNSGNGDGNGGSGDAGSDDDEAPTRDGSPSEDASEVTGATGGSPDEDQSWWEKSWQYMVMIIVLVVAFAIIIALGIWLKKRHNRKRDQINGGFNAGITARSTSGLPMAAGSTLSVVPTGTQGGRDSPARTRDAFMPYGYGYTRSESRLAAEPRGQTPVGELEKSAMQAETETAAPVTPSKRERLRKAMGREKGGN